MRWGRIHIRSGYRSPSVNKFGNENKLNCASNEANYAAHIWDYADQAGKHGATACIVIPWLVDRFEQGGSWTEMAWWIHDHLPYSSLCFFPKLWAFNINWHEQPQRRIDSYVAPRGCLTRPGMSNHSGSHKAEYGGFPMFSSASDTSRCGRGPAATSVSELAWETSQNLPSSLAIAAPASFSRSAATGTSASIATSASGRIYYRAVHTKTLWRKVNTHRSLEAAVSGKDGAAALFAGKVRINYEKHGAPLYVAVWQEGAQYGVLVAPGPGGGVRKVTVPVNVLTEFERQGQASPRVLARLL
jgi:hypothetical protein